MGLCELQSCLEVVVYRVSEAKTHVSRHSHLARPGARLDWSTSAPAPPPENLSRHPPRAYGEWANFVAAVVDQGVPRLTCDGATSMTRLLGVLFCRRGWER